MIIQFQDYEYISWYPYKWYHFNEVEGTAIEGLELWSREIVLDWFGGSFISLSSCPFSQEPSVGADLAAVGGKFLRVINSVASFGRFWAAAFA